MSVMDSIEEKYEDEIAKLKAALAEKEEQLRSIRLSMGDDYGTDPVTFIPYLKKRIAVLTTGNRKCKDFVKEHYPSDHWDLVMEKERAQEQIAALKIERIKDSAVIFGQRETIESLIAQNQQWKKERGFSKDG